MSNESNVRSRMAKYGRTPKRLLRDGTISSNARLLYAMVDEVAGHEVLTIARVAHWLGTSESTARRAIRELRDTGWLEVTENFDDTGKGQLPSTYVTNAWPFNLTQCDPVTGDPNQ